MFLLVDNSPRAMFAPYVQRYVLFSSFEECARVAHERGFKDPYGMFNGPPEPGVMVQFKGGDVDVSYMEIEVSKTSTSAVDNNEAQA